MAEATLKKVTAYTDGACLGNPGPGGYGVVLLSGGNRKELSGGFRLTTNNRMELMAAVTALETLREPCMVTLYSDSQYLVNGINEGWALKWRTRGWMRNQKEKALNADLWERLLRQWERQHVELHWVRGHAEVIENDRCDELAVKAAKQPDLPEDRGYIRVTL